jgi:hypothetical protein
MPLSLHVFVGSKALALFDIDSAIDSVGLVSSDVSAVKYVFRV